MILSQPHLLKDKNGYAGSIYDYQHKSIYRIYPISNEVSAFINVESDSGTIEICGNIPPEAPRPPDNCRCDEEIEDCSSHIDILFLLLPSVQEWIANQNFNDTYLNILISELNLAFANSMINHTIDYNWVDYEWEWDGPGEDGIDDCRYEIEDLKLDPTAIGLREEYGADIVVLLRSDDPWGTGVDGCTTKDFQDLNPENGFIILDVASTLKLPKFSHEIGHVFGARHKYEPINGKDQDCSYAHLLRFIELDQYGNPFSAEPSIWTIMRITAGELLHFSDPEIDFNGVPTGTEVTISPNGNTDPERNNAGQIRSAGVVVSNFMDSPNINGVATIFEDDCMLNLIANVQPANSAYEYIWNWSYDGIFTNEFPSILLGTGESLVVEEPEGDNCINYFIQMVILLDGEVVETEVYVQGGGICTENVQECNEETQQNRIDQSIQSSIYQPHELNSDNSIIKKSDISYVVDIFGRILLFNKNNLDINEVRNLIETKYKGVYFIVNVNNKKNISRHISF